MQSKPDWKPSDLVCNGFDILVDLLGPHGGSVCSPSTGIPNVAGGATNLQRPFWHNEILVK